MPDAAGRLCCVVGDRCTHLDGHRRLAALLRAADGHVVTDGELGEAAVEGHDGAGEGEAHGSRTVLRLTAGGHTHRAAPGRARPRRGHEAGEGGDMGGGAHGDRTCEEQVHTFFFLQPECARCHFTSITRCVWAQEPPKYGGLATWTPLAARAWVKSSVVSTSLAACHAPGGVSARATGRPR